MCGGDNSTCNILNGVIEFSTFKNGAYEPVLILPANATSIRISEKSLGHDSNYLAMRDLEGSIVILYIHEEKHFIKQFYFFDYEKEIFI